MRFALFSTPCYRSPMPLRSMTGFGAASRPFIGPEGPTTCQLEIRSVNARFLELKIRQPFGPRTEQEIRAVVEACLQRGRVELGVVMRRADASTPDDPLAAFGLDPTRVRAALAAAAEVSRVAAENSLELSAFTATELLRFLASTSRSTGPEIPDAPPFLTELVREALQQLLAFRATEGEALTAAISELVDGLHTVAAALRADLPAERDRLQDRLAQRVQQLCERAGIDGAPPERIAQEIAIAVARGDIEEELARIDSHLAQMRTTIAAPPHKGQGKTLDFVTQELLREVTTIGSKITSHAGSRIVIDAKALIERIREQVQNVE
jgi:uncharacterized protein (TIGR00255 family)